ncbi:MAG TPA: SpoIIE family protein phosphatase [Telluria sp.]|nr:SpoIIE family protein phosphatase [Telluria sp.]
MAAARRGGQKLADRLGFDETRSGQLALIVTESATNILKHAGEGTLYICTARSFAAVGVDVIAVDNGPGIADMANCLRDGVSTTGTSGTGLGALRRLSDEFDVYSAHGQGTAFFMRIWRDAGYVARPGAVEIGALGTPLAGEDESGDGWAVACDDAGVTLLAVDGLGHGPEAAKAAAGAIGALARGSTTQPATVVESAHEALRVTRGAALAAGRLDLAAGELRFAGIGNISAAVYDGETRRQLVSHNGIVGHNMRKVQEFVVPCAPGSVCTMHSDGINTQWDLAEYPGLHLRNPALVAAILMRDFIRRRDDAMVLVVRRRGEGA